MADMAHTARMVMKCDSCARCVVLMFRAQKWSLKLEFKGGLDRCEICYISNMCEVHINKPSEVKDLRNRRTKSRENNASTGID